jgi:hypothetical protein
MRAILVSVVQDGCEACKLYKDHQQAKLVDLVKKDLRLGMITYRASYNEKNEATLVLEAVNVGTPTMRRDFHPDLLSNAYNAWRPSWYLFDLQDWGNHNNNLEGDIYCGKIINDSTGREMVSDPTTTYSIEAESVYYWLVESISKRETNINETTYLNHKKRNRDIYYNL